MLCRWHGADAAFLLYTDPMELSQLAFAEWGGKDPCDAWICREDNDPPPFVLKCQAKERREAVSCGQGICLGRPGSQFLALP